MSTYDSAGTLVAANALLVANATGDLTLNGTGTGLTVTNNIALNGHFISTQGTAPTVVQSGGSGSSTLNAQATDMKGTVTEGSSATGFVLTFNTAYATTPDCVVTSPTGTVVTSYTPAAGTLTVVNSAATGAKLTYQCLQ